jgi:hypothetical protein
VTFLPASTSQASQKWYVFVLAPGPSRVALISWTTQPAAPAAAPMLNHTLHWKPPEPRSLGPATVVMSTACETGALPAAGPPPPARCTSPEWPSRIPSATGVPLPAMAARVTRLPADCCSAVMVAYGPVGLVASASRRSCRVGARRDRSLALCMVRSG